MITYTLSEFTILIKDTISYSFPDAYWVTAEIARINLNQKGHCYLELVEKMPDTPEPVARISANIWVYNYRELAARFNMVTKETLKPGMKVLLQVSVQFHQVYGLSLNVRDIDPTYSMGEMARRKREVIERLRKEGIIDLNKALPLPLVPQRIAVISSPTAAGYEDLVEHLNNNSCGYRLTFTLFQALMQGEKAEGSIVSALTDVQAQSNLFDVAAVIRGGGSQVDLSCFDNYDLAFRVATFPLPVITGIGHERDDTVVDIVAHTRLKTPTAVAEFIISGMRSFEERVIDLQRKLITASERMIKDKNHIVTMQSRSFLHGIQSYITNKEQSLKNIEQAVRLLDPVNVLKRGYSITSLNGKILRSIENINKGDIIQTRLNKGLITSAVNFLKDIQKDKMSDYTD
ncbi:MAG: exodeoxyribonuclease VII large subunit [Thermodesulfobacteriota bacterium]